jgi:hypothetical protein
MHSPVCGTGEDVPGLFSIRATISSIAARKASGDAACDLVMSNERIMPRREAMGENRQESPARSGRVPGGAGASANSPRFMAASAHARPPPEKIA